MAEDVTNTVKIIFQKEGGLCPKESETLLAKLKVYFQVYTFTHQILILFLDATFIYAGREALS